MSMAIFRERSKSRFCISPGKRPFTEIDHVTGNEKQKKKRAECMLKLYE